MIRPAVAAVVTAALSVAQAPRPAAESALRERVRQRPADFQANHQLAEFYASTGKLPAAIRYFEAALRIDPAHYVNGYDLALAYAQTGALDRARHQIQQMLARGDRAELQNLLGLVEEKAGNIQLAADRYQRAAQADPTEKHVFDLGNCFLRYRGAEQAIEIFRWGIDRFPKSARMRVGLGIAYYARGQYDKAVEALCEGVDLDPLDPRPIDFLAKVFDVSPELADDVTKRLARFVEVYPANATANYYYALSLWKRISAPDSARRQSQVERYLKKAIALDPKLADAHFQLGTLYQDQERLPEAVREFELAVRIDSQSGKYRYRLGQAYRAAGQEEKAREQLRAYQELHAGQADSKP